MTKDYFCATGWQICEMEATIQTAMHQMGELETLLKDTRGEGIPSEAKHRESSGMPGTACRYVDHIKKLLHDLEYLLMDQVLVREQLVLNIGKEGM